MDTQGEHGERISCATRRSRGSGVAGVISACVRCRVDESFFWDEREGAREAGGGSADPGSKAVRFLWCALGHANVQRRHAFQIQPHMAALGLVLISLSFQPGPAHSSGVLGECVDEKNPASYRTGAPQMFLN